MKVIFLMLSSQNGLFEAEQVRKRPEVREKTTILFVMKLFVQLVILYDSGSGLMKKDSFQSN